MTNEETVTITQTAPDGTETKIEITQTPPEGADQSLVDEVIDAIFDDAGDDSDIHPLDDQTGHYIGTFEPVTQSPTETQPAESEVMLPVEYNTSTEQVPFTDTTPDISPIAESAGSESDAVDSTNVAELAEQQVHAEAARDAQEAANEFVKAGDYEAAAEAREVAENEAWEAGDQSILEGSSSTDLASAAQEQDFAEYHQKLQDEYTAQGDYDAAQAEADKVVEHTSNADFSASGDDHSTEARNEEYQLSNAVWEESNAEFYSRGAEEFAQEGNYDAAADFAETAGEHQEAADYDAASTLDGSTYDASSAVETGGSYDAGADYSSIDTSGTDFSGSE